MDKFGEGKFFFKENCQYNGISYREVLPVKIDNDNSDNVICETTDFGSKRSFNKNKIVHLKETVIEWETLNLGSNV